MILFITWILASYGFTNIITQGSIFWKLRNWIWNKNKYLGDWIHCPMCFGFWAGILLSWLWYTPTSNIILDGFLASGCSWILHVLVSGFQHIAFYDPENKGKP